MVPKMVASPCCGAGAAGIKGHLVVLLQQLRASLHRSNTFGLCYVKMIAAASSQAPYLFMLHM